MNVMKIKQGNEILVPLARGGSEPGACSLLFKGETHQVREALKPEATPMRLPPGGHVERQGQPGGSHGGVDCYSIPTGSVMTPQH